MTNPYESPAEIAHFGPKPADANHQRQIETEQSRVDRLLNRGVVFSIIWLLGGGAIYSVLLASRAHKIISRSGGTVYGMRRVWWCYAIGGFGILLVTTVLISLMLNG